MRQTLRRLLLGGLAVYVLLIIVCACVGTALADDEKTPEKTAAKTALGEKTGDAKTGDAKTGDAKTGDAKKPQSLADIKSGKKKGKQASAWDRIRSVFGLAFLIGICVLMSNNRKRISWKLVGWGLALQLFLGVLIMVPVPGLGRPLLLPLFELVNDIFMKLMAYTTDGSSFLFGNLSKTGNVPVGPGGPFGPVKGEGSMAEVGAFFAFGVLPTIIFFSSLMAVMYHIGVMQLVVKGMATVMQKTMGTSGAETLSAAGNIFVGQTEAPLLVRPYVNRMTESELMAVMTGGFATVAGGVMAAYVFMLHTHFPDIAGHLLSASVMSAPAALVCAKLVIPEPVPEKSETFGELKVELEKVDVNVIDAAARGAGDGLKLALNVGAMLLAFLALIAMFNGILGWVSNGLADAAYGDTWEERVTDVQKDWGAMQAQMAREEAERLEEEPGSAPPEEEAEWVTERKAELAARFAGLAREALGESQEYEVVFEADRPSDAELDADGKLHVGPNSLDPKKVGVKGIAQKKEEVSVSPYRGGVADEEEMGAEPTLRKLSFETLLGWLLAPLAWLLGVPWSDALAVGQLIGVKTVLNEFVAFDILSSMLASDAIEYDRSKVIAIYALCGFANFGSIAIQIGGIGGIAPDRKHDLAKLGLRAMIAGTIAALMTATVAGLLF